MLDLSLSELIGTYWQIRKSAKNIVPGGIEPGHSQLESEALPLGQVPYVLRPQKAYPFQSTKCSKRGKNMMPVGDRTTALLSKVGPATTTPIRRQLGSAQLGGSCLSDYVGGRLVRVLGPVHLPHSQMIALCAVHKMSPQTLPDTQQRICVN